MRPFQYQRADSPQAAVRAANASVGSENAVLAPVQYLAGGTTLIDLMKLDVMRPATLIDINDLQREHSAITTDANGLHLGAFAHMAEAAEMPAVIQNYPVIAQSLQLAASAQLRHMATLSGNVLQRTRCNYFRDVSYRECNKRQPGSGCAALQGVNRKLAVLGVSDACIAHYPGDFAQALVALDASAELIGSKGKRIIKVEDIHRLPGTTPHLETNLAPDELIVAFHVPAARWNQRSLYLKVRDRESYEFALASAAVALDLEGRSVKEARIALGGVAAKPWRAHEAEAALKGNTLDESTATRAAETAFAQARTHGDNDFKPELGRRTLVRALMQCAALEV